MSPLSNVNVEDMTEAVWRRLVVTALHDITVGINGVSDDPNNMGLAGAVAEAMARIRYEEQQRKTYIDPKINAVRSEIRAAQKCIDDEITRQKAWRSGLAFALGTTSGVLGVIVALQVI